MRVCNIMVCLFWKDLHEELLKPKIPKPKKRLKFQDLMMQEKVWLPIPEEIPNLRQYCCSHSLTEKGEPESYWLTCNYKLSWTRTRVTKSCWSRHNDDTSVKRLSLNLLCHCHQGLQIPGYCLNVGYWWWAVLLSTLHVICSTTRILR